MNTDIYTIDKTPSTELEKYQALRIEALEKELQKHKDFLKEMQQAMEKHINNIEVVSEIVDDYKYFSS